MSMQVCGWGVMSGDEKCQIGLDCPNPAVCYVAPKDDTSEMYSCCNPCAINVAKEDDLVAEVFRRVGLL